MNCYVLNGPPYSQAPTTSSPQALTVRARFTDGARTVVLRGPLGIFREPGVTATVTTDAWVCLLPSPYAGTIDDAWLQSALADRSPDLLALAFEYPTGAAGDAGYGPLVDGARQEGADFNDYLGISYRYPDGTVERPESSQLGDLDCSGFMRMIWGYRSGVRLSLDPDGGRSLPRRAVAMASAMPGVALRGLSELAPGHFLFFDASTDDGTAIDHVGMYLGKDSSGHLHFVSSRKIANGPTMGDLAGRSAVDGTGFYATAFRLARRL